MSLLSFLLAYLLGGLTFFPLALLALLLHAHLTLTVYTGPSHDSSESTSLLEAEKKAKELSTRRASDADVASGFFAVCREYTPAGINAKPLERTTPVGSTTVAPASQSVYQAMYKTLFERNKGAQKETENAAASARPKKAGNVFFVVLRHGHLMLFDDEEQLEVRHVISLAHHNISIYGGLDRIVPEGELFIKRNAICLSRRTDSPDPTPDSTSTKPFYLFCENCSAKEDFYFCLLRNQEHTFTSNVRHVPPPPQAFEIKDIISLVQKLHSTEDHSQTRWLNAFIGRLFLAVYKTDDVHNYIRRLLMKKISRVKTPSFLTNIAIRGIHTGEGPPYITNPKLKELTVDGEYLAEADIKYTGNVRVEVAATARIDLGARFKAREVDLVLAVTLKRLEGHILFKVKPPPSNRLWFSFAAMPKMEMEVAPVVSSRQITYNVILRQIENRIKEVVAESLVQPFWDDVPFFKTEDKKWRGGVFERNEAVTGEDKKVNETKKEIEAGAIQNDPTVLEKQQEDEPPVEKIAPIEKSHTFANADSNVIHRRKVSGVSASGNDIEGFGSTSAIDLGSHYPPLHAPPHLPRPSSFASGDTDKLAAAVSASASTFASAFTTAATSASISPPAPAELPKTPARPSPSRKASVQVDHETPPELPPRRPSHVSMPSQSSVSSPHCTKSPIMLPQEEVSEPNLLDMDNVIASPARVHPSGPANHNKMAPPVFPDQIGLETEPTPYGGRRGTVSSLDSDGNNSHSGPSTTAGNLAKLNKSNTVNSIKSQAGSFFSKTMASITTPSSASSTQSLNGSSTNLSNMQSRNNSASHISTGSPSPSNVRADSRFSAHARNGSLTDLAEMSPNSSHPHSPVRSGSPLRDSDASFSPVNVPKRNTLAAVTSAAVQARNWGIKALASRKENNNPAHSNGSGPVHGYSQSYSQPSIPIDLSQPMGRGQPLPPIGTPLPGPQKGRITSLPGPQNKRHSLNVLPPGSTVSGSPAGFGNGLYSNNPTTGTPAITNNNNKNNGGATIGTVSPTRIPSPLPLRRTPSMASVGSNGPRSLSRTSSRQSLRHASPVQRRAFEEGSMIPTVADPAYLVVAAPEEGSEPSTSAGEDNKEIEGEVPGLVKKRSYRRISYNGGGELGGKRSLSRLRDRDRREGVAEGGEEGENR